ncbi:Cro/CI family transcriptional regulator [Sodalis glossinidius]|uniref:Cro/CI family transcriptional regulator n=1 Tax=Sodalis glossinidius TaxID=63612 RepID=UPI0009FC071E|nr:Cro/CI family transcriptional regulator [Sodalis glossinidius]
MKKIDVLKFFDGSFTKTAQALGISHAAVSRWRDVIPEKRAFQLELITQGRFKRNADLYGSKNSKNDLSPKHNGGENLTYAVQP